MMKKIQIFCTFLFVIMLAWNLQAQTCFYTINMRDSYGDGWGDLYLEIKQGGTPIGTFTFENGYSSTQTLPITHGLQYTIHWHQAAYASEASFEILDVLGNIVYSCSDAQNLGNGQIFSFYGNCSGCVPTTTNFVSVNQNSATISWNSTEASQYQIAIGTSEPDTLNPYLVQDTFYIFTGLMSETTYNVSLRAVCDISTNDYSEWTTFSFTTSQAPASMPFICDFENAVEAAQWELANGTETNQWRIGTAVNHTEDGQNALYISKDNGVTNSYDTTAVSSVYAYRDINFPTTTNDFLFSFYWKNQGESVYCEPIKVYVGDVSPIQAGEGDYYLEIPGTTLLGTFYGNGAEWTHETFVLDAEEYAGSVRRIYFFFYSDAANGRNPAPAIDDIILKEIICPEVDSVQISEISNNSVRITPYSDPSVTAYMLYYKALSDVTYSVVSIPSEGYTLTGLTPGTRYQYYLTTDCGNEEYGLPTPDSYFYTLCDVVYTFPWIENFEGEWFPATSTAGNESAPMCWLNFNYGTTPGQWELKHYEFVSGNSCASMFGTMSNDNEDVNNDWLLTPILSLTGNERLNFFVKKSHLSYTDDFSIYSVFVGNGDVTNFDDVLANAYCIKPSTIATDEWVAYELSLGACIGDYRLAFVRDALPGGSQLFIDSVVVSTMPTCPDVYHVEVNPASETSIAVNFSVDNATGQGWEIAYAPTGDEPFDEVTATVVSVDYSSSLPIIIENLQPNISYTFAVRQACNGDWSDTIVCTIPFMNLQQLPFECDFESEDENSTWVMAQDSNLTNRWYIGTAAASQGVKSLYISKNDGLTNEYVTSEPSLVVAYVDLAMTEAEQYLFSFDWKCVGEGYYDDLSVCLLPLSISLDNLNPNGALPAWVERYKLANNSYKLSTSDTYRTVTAIIDAENIKGTVRRLAFIWKNDDFSGSGYAASVDNISVTPITCHIPSNVVVAPGATDAIVSWASTASEWLISYRIGSGDWTEVQVSENQIVLDGLQAETDYQLFVRTLCDADTSFASELIEFTTLCMPDSIPYFEDFNDLPAPDFSVNVLPNSCWKVANGSLDAYSLLSYDVAFSFWMPQNSEMVAGMEEHFGGSISSTNKQWLITPLINLGDGSQLYQLELDLMLTGYNLNDAISTNNYDDEFAIVISTDNGATWSRDNAFIWSNAPQADRMLNDLAGSVNHIIIPLENQNNEPYMNNIMIAFYIGSSTYNATNTIRIDNFAINPYTVCTRPENLMVTDVQNNEISIAWQAGADEMAWQAIIVPEGASIENEIPVDIYDTTYTFFNLEPNTEYTIYLRSDCGYDQSLYITTSAVTECATVNTMPFIENFEEYETEEYPICWQRISATTTLTTSPSVTTFGGVSGSNALRFYSSTTPIYALLPELDFTLPVNTLQVTFKAKSSNNSVTPILVGVMDSVSGSFFVAVDTIELTAQYSAYHVSFENYTGTGKYIAFKHHDTSFGYDETYIDEVFVDFLPNCNTPQSLAVSGIRADRATMSWTDAEDITTWNIIVVEGTEVADFSDYTIVNTNSYELEELQSNTSYVVYLRSVCPDGNSFSSWTNISFMTTHDNLAQTPYFHNFESAEENENWVIVNGEAVNKWHINTLDNNSDSVLFVSYDGSNASYYGFYTVVWAYRDIIFNEASEYELSFNWRCNGEHIYDNLTVYLGNPVEVQASNVSDVVTPPVGAVQLGEALHSSSEWQRFSILLDETYSDRVQRLYFCWKNDNSTNNNPPAIIDSIQISAFSCARPYNLVAESVHPTSAQLHFFSARSEDNAWEYVITSAGENPNTLTPVEISDTIFTISNLTAETSYTVYVRTSCGNNNYSDWSNSATFTTLESCATPINVLVENVTNNSVTVTWGEMGDANQWSVEYGPVGFSHGQGTTIVATDDSLVISGLTSATTYDLYVRANCSVTEQSNWSDVVTFTTECDIVSAFPYNEGFENPLLPECWSQEYLSGTENWIIYNGTGTGSSLSNAYAGSYNAHFASYNYNENSSRLISPIFDLTQLSEPTLTFWYAIPNWDDTTDELNIYYRTSAIGSWQLLTSHTETVNTWTLDSLSLPNPSSYYQLAFEAKSNYGYGVAIDEILIGERVVIDPCDVPTNVQVAPAETSAVVTWTSPETTWIVEHKAVTANSWTASAALNVPTYSISGLTPSTDYIVRVKSICGNGNESDWSAEVPFTTMAAQVNTYTITATATGPGTITPTGAITVNEGDNATFTFTADAGAVIDQLLVDNEETAIPADNNYTFSNIVANHTIAVEFVEETSISENDLSAAVVLYPNPATSQVQIRVADSRLVGAEMQLFDAYGKIVATSVLESNMAQVDVSHLANGIYLVRINATEGIVTKRFVKR